MAVWNRPASNWGNMSNSSPVVRRTGFSGWASLPWDELGRDIKLAQQLELKAREDINLASYTRFITNKEKELSILSEGSIEENITDAYPYKPLPPSETVKIKRNIANGIVDAWLARLRVNTYGVTLISELTKLISQYKLSTMDGEDYNAKLVKEKLMPSIADTSENRELGSKHISPIALYKSMVTDDTMFGIYNFLMLDSRSGYLEKQYTGPGRNFCALVPLIMSAFRMHRGVPYSHWYPPLTSGIINPKLFSAMTFSADPKFTQEEILAARESGLLVKSGKTSGTSRNPLYTFKLYGAEGFQGVPELAQVMLAQIWCAHPSNRTTNMVLDFDDWDNVPDPIVAADTMDTTAIPWEDTNTSEDRKVKNPWE